MPERVSSLRYLVRGQYLECPIAIPPTIKKKHHMLACLNSFEGAYHTDKRNLVFLLQAIGISRKLVSLVL
jgi:hypothetical protein